MAGVLPKAEALTVTPRTGQFNRQRKESRLDRASFSCGPGGGLVFSPADTWREHPQAPERRVFHSILTIQRRGFSGAGPASFFPAERLPVFPGGVIRIAGTMPRLRGFARPASFSSWLSPDDGSAPGAPSRRDRLLPFRRRGPVLSGRPPPQVPGDGGSRLSRLDLDSLRGNDHPRRRTTTNAGIPGCGSRPAVSPDAPARPSHGHGGGRPVLDDAAAPLSRTTSSACVLPLFSR